METTVEPAKDIKSITVKDLLNAGLHFGHQTKRWNPKMKRYIFDKRNGIHIIDLSKSLAKMQEAMQFVREMVLRGNKILFVGTKKQSQNIVKEAAESCGQPYVTFRWLGGSLTNNSTIRKSVSRMREVEKLEGGANNFAGIAKKEASVLRHELEKLRRNLSGVATMTNLPGALFVVDINREAIAVAEANRLNIPVIAIVDTNCNPDPVNYVIPGNDDSMRAIKLLAEVMASTIKDANREYAKIAAELTKKREAEEAARAASRAAEKAAAEEAREERKKKLAEKLPLPEKLPGLDVAVQVDETEGLEVVEAGHAQRKGKKIATKPSKTDKPAE